MKYVRNMNTVNCELPQLKIDSLSSSMQKIRSYSRSRTVIIASCVVSESCECFSIWLSTKKKILQLVPAGCIYFYWARNSGFFMSENKKYSIESPSRQTWKENYRIFVYPRVRRMWKRFVSRYYTRKKFCNLHYV